MISFRAEIHFDVSAEKVEKATKSGIRNIARKIHESAVMHAPVGNPDNWKYPESAPPGYVGGRLRNSLSYAMADDVSGGNSSGGQKADPNAFVEKPTSELQAFIGTRVDYAFYVETGTSKRSAQPYLRPALDEVKPQILSILADAINRELKK